ncbi:MAG: chromate efflux transporter, partial [Caldilineaceae bacterium]
MSVESPASGPGEPVASATHTPVRATLGELARYFTHLGFVAFGGPAAHIAMMQEELVERRRWVEKRYYLDMLGATQLVPGPNSTEMAIHIGYLHRGVRGLLVAGLCFIFPAFLLVLGLSLFYGAFGSLPQVQAIFYGIQPVVVAIVLLAVIKLGPGALKSPLTTGVAIMALLATLLLPVNTIWVILGGGAILLAAHLVRRVPAALAAIVPLPLLAPGALTLTHLLQNAASEPTLLGLFRFFLGVGATAMGSGYVIASYFTDGLVERLGWLTSAQVVDAIAVGQMTPGPVFTSAAFAGYLAMAGPANNVAAGIAGASVSVVAIFLPSFFIVWLMAPWV